MVLKRGRSCTHGKPAPTPADSSITLPAYKQFVLEDPPPLRAFGVAGLIAAGEPEGVIRAAAEWSEYRPRRRPGSRRARVAGRRRARTATECRRVLDDRDDQVRPYALSGLCLFVRNAPTVTGQSVVLMSWLQSRQPAPYLTPATQRYCLLGGKSNPPPDLDAYVSFWKSWWSEHRADVEGR